MDAQRRAFLESVEADMTTSRPQANAGSGTAPTGRWKRLGVKGAAAGALLAGVSFLALPATPAQARPTVVPQPRSVVIQDGPCYTPNMEQRDHQKVCVNRYTFYNYTYLYADHVHTNLWCFIFDATWFSCGGANYIGRKTRCGYL